MKVASVAVAWLGVACASAAGCGGTQGGETAAPTVTAAPDDFVLRDVRKDAARHLSCQVPDIRVVMGPWAGAEGNVTAVGCGYQLNYYLRCMTNHHCSFTVAD